MGPINVTISKTRKREKSKTHEGDKKVQSTKYKINYKDVMFSTKILPAFYDNSM